jgi:dUTP pyrophosphatase
MSAKVKLAIRQLDHAKGLPLPFYATVGSSGMDVTAAVEDDMTLHAGERTLIPTGLCFDIPEGYEIQVRPRSGLALKYGLTVLNTPGTIDSDYQGELKIILVNLCNEPFIVERGMRIAQIVISPVVQAEIVTVDKFENVSERNTGGFGSTGVRAI